MIKILVAEDEEKSRAAETAVADAKRFRALAGEMEGA